MRDGAEIDQWYHTANLMAMVGNTVPGVDTPFRAEDFHPWLSEPGEDNPSIDIESARDYFGGCDTPGSIKRRKKMKETNS